MSSRRVMLQENYENTKHYKVGDFLKDSNGNTCECVIARTAPSLADVQTQVTNALRKVAKAEIPPALHDRVSIEHLGLDESSTHKLLCEFFHANPGVRLSTEAVTVADLVDEVWSQTCGISIKSGDCHWP